MTCYLSDETPESPQEIINSVKEIHDEIIRLQTLQRPTPENLRWAFNSTYNEDEFCLFCKVREDGDNLTFYTSNESIFDVLWRDLMAAIATCQMGGSAIVEVKDNPYIHDDSPVLIKITFNIWDSIPFFKRLYEKNLKNYKEWALEYYDDCCFTRKEKESVTRVITNWHTGRWG